MRAAFAVPYRPYERPAEIKRAMEGYAAVLFAGPSAWRSGPRSWVRKEPILVLQFVRHPQKPRTPVNVLALCQMEIGKVDGGLHLETRKVWNMMFRPWPDSEGHTLDTGRQVVGQPIWELAAAMDASVEDAAGGGSIDAGLDWPEIELTGVADSGVAPCREVYEGLIVEAVRTNPDKLIVGLARKKLTVQAVDRLADRQLILFTDGSWAHLPRTAHLVGEPRAGEVIAANGRFAHVLPHGPKDWVCGIEDVATLIGPDGVEVLIEQMHREYCALVGETGVYPWELLPRAALTATAIEEKPRQGIQVVRREALLGRVAGSFYDLAFVPPRLFARLL